MELTGTSFPSFSLPDQHEKEWTETNFKDTWTVLYAYPKDMTSGCTREAHEFSEKLDEFKKAGAQILGISPDDLKKHNTFCEKEGIPFPLLSDTEKALLEKLGVWVEKSMYGNKYMGVERSTWLIDPQGTIVKEWRKVKVPNHVQEVFEELQKHISAQ